MERLKLANGNFKIGKDTFILNITSATDCESMRLGLCDIGAKCYALKAEKQYKVSCLGARRDNTKIFDAMSAREIAADIVGRAARKKKHKIKYMRFSESGDFRTQADVKKISTIADKLAPHGITIYGYTARRDLDYSRVSSNMVINGSGFMLSNQFTAAKDTSGAAIVCPMDCKTCDICKLPRGAKITVPMH